MAVPAAGGPEVSRAGRSDAPVLLVGIGDTHGDFRPLFLAAEREPDARALLQVGDLTAGKPGRDARPDDDPAALARLPVPLIWVHGNHEHWEVLGLGNGAPAVPCGRCPADAPAPPAPAARAKTPGYHLWAGMEYVVPGTSIRIAGLPGNYAPTWYEREKPFPGDRVRHFNAADVAAVARLRRPSVLLMHEAFRGHSSGRVGAMGIPVLARLVRQVRPSVCLTGHHHTFAVGEHGPMLAIALPRATEGYVRLVFTPGGKRLGWEFVSFTGG